MNYEHLTSNSKLLTDLLVSNSSLKASKCAEICRNSYSEDKSAVWLSGPLRVFTSCSVMEECHASGCWDNMVWYHVGLLYMGLMCLWEESVRLSVKMGSRWLDGGDLWENSGFVLWVCGLCDITAECLAAGLFWMVYFDSLEAHLWGTGSRKRTPCNGYNSTDKQMCEFYPVTTVSLQSSFFYP